MQKKSYFSSLQWRMKMQKFDESCGLTKKQIHIIKYNIKKEISKQLPLFPERIEMKLFIEGRDAWTYRWSLKQYILEPKQKVFIEVIVKLKKEFPQYNEIKYYEFSCEAEPIKDIYRPKLSITKKNA